MTDEKIKIILNEAELDWLDHGHGFASDLDEPWGDEVADSIIEKMRKSWKNKENYKKGEFKLLMSKKEVNFIYNIMFDFLLDEYTECGDYNDEDYCSWKSFRERMDLTNTIIEKMGKQICTIEILEKELNKLKNK